MHAYSRVGSLVILMTTSPAADADASTMQMVHAGPMFLPWHRELLLRFENALREVSGKPLTVPYWDWTDPESVNPDNPHSVFRDDFMGGTGSSSWAIWQARHPGRTYEPKTGHESNNADSPMVPFARASPQAVENIANLGYRYE